MRHWTLTIAASLLLLPVSASANLPATPNPHGDLRWDCQECHTANSWSELRDSLAFSHDQTEFALRGAHTAARCAGCHRDPVFTKTGDNCADCHEDFHKGQLGTDCASCHTSYSWLNRDALFDRHAARGFALTGVHAVADCDACHLEQQPKDFAGTSGECQSCHNDDFVSVTEPNHLAAGFAAKCESCHSRAADTWLGAEYVHPATFPLVDGHGNATCNACHKETYAGTSAECASCHESDFTEAADPNHVDAQFSQNCAECHTIVAWAPAEFDHNLASFSLTGAHIGADCARCHTEQYTDTPSECVACHMTDVLAASDPNHEEAGFPNACEVCHGTEAWAPSHIDHSLTNFALTGAHVSVDCNSCHAASYTGTSAECYACHNDDFASVTDPNHVTNNFSHECTPCHNTTAWLPVEFDHNLTAFPLTGAHTSVDCGVCHSAGYDATSAACYSCHEADYAEAPDPDHAANNFDHECTSCHNTSAWQPADFDHNLTEFTLTGAHAEATCVSCHAAGYTGTPTDCFACHENEYTAVPDPDHAGSGFAHACAQCHVTGAWKPAEYDHNLAAFTLTGAHLATDCNSCHSSGFTGTPSECFVCHEQNYDDTDNPDHALIGLDHNCTTCHTTNAWEPADFDHNTTSFPLTGAHTGAACNLCHAGTTTGLSVECYACHEPDYAGTVDPDHVGSDFPTECDVCHSTSAWRPSSIDHDITSFPLTGAHAAVDCSSCHADGYTGTPDDCYACHDDDYTNVIDPNHVQAGFDQNCTTCHTTDAWLPASFDHDLTDFPLAGAHAGTDCNSCHTDGYTGTLMECYACHESDYAGTVDPDHVGSGFPTLCGVCHTVEAWEPSHIDHGLTSFPLTGAHVAVDCATCHASGYTGTPSDCFACHDGDFNGVGDPDHAANNFDHNCTTCHSMNGWTPSTFDHNQTSFPLTGAHTTTTCVDCHSTGYTGTSMECFACHEIDFTGTTDPDHVANAFGHNCATCHNTNAWEPADFNHNQTTFPLLGAHLAVDCGSCHTNGYTNTPSDCFACHDGDFNGVGDPDHAGNNFDHDCTTCHSMNGWTPSTFDHNQTSFPLTGAHTTTTCVNCHSTGYTGTPMECFACHEIDFNGTTDPDHVANGFGQNCAACHNTNAWEPADFNHNQTTFPLLGAHLAVDCGSCHTNGYTNTLADCFACHDGDFDGVGDPDHAGNYFDHDCTTCHSMNGWTPSTFDHNQTSFPLTGAHTTTTCVGCHNSGYTGTPTDCFACHNGDFNGVADPNHLQSGFNHDCAQCHTTNAWEPADYDHNLSQFQLTGAHLAVACVQCHASGYTGTPSECLACHNDDYLGTNDPDHAVAGFPTTCESCHTTNAWTPADWDHDGQYFPIYSGKHREKWQDCNECHTVPGNYTQFECIFCHEHRQSAMDDKHSDENGYVYASSACLSCHPNGSE